MSRPAAIVAAICLLTAIRVASTHSVFSQTFDEPIHVAAGHEYLTKHVYMLDREHPPIARVFFALPFRNVVSTKDDWVQWGIELYLSTGDYVRGIAASRRGNLLFLVVGIAAVALWAWELFGPRVAVIAAVIFAMLPPILAHGGLATTDMAGAAAFSVAMLALYRWLASPSWARTALLGAATGFGLVAKFSFPLFFAASAIVVMVARRRCPIVKGLVAHALALTIVWAVYLFDFRQLVDVDSGTAETARTLFGSSRFATGWHLPAPMFFIGLMQVAMHNRTGHLAYFLGEVADHGWWYYFPVVLAIKTPLPLFALTAAGSWLSIRRRRYGELIVIILVLLLSTMTSRINLGIRHLLPIYAPMSILAAYAVVELWRTRAHLAVAGLVAWLCASSVIAHPDYLPWMNIAAGPRPERIVLDSNFDWGQDVVRLRDETRARQIKRIGTFLFGTTDQVLIGLPERHEIDPFRGAPGWYAVSESAIIPAQARDPLAYVWLTGQHRFIRVGKTIRLYHVTAEY